ncbi:UNVERIFIED_CONTAM: hypothetical protein GTU68_054057 [Idotea baltica]|nr:hypothetical protein [Idotea baltica]
MAQGFINHYGGQGVQCDSAGLIAKGVHPLAIKVMNEVGVDISSHTSNAIDDYATDTYDVTLTVCDHAKETCPVFPQSTKTIHHTFRDPDHYQGTELEVLNRFREIRDEISEFTKQLVNDL